MERQGIEKERSTERENERYQERGTEIEKEIQKKENELKLKESSLLSTNVGFEKVGTDVRPTKGMYALASWMCPTIMTVWVCC
jgi:hypothetical protein